MSNEIYSGTTLTSMELFEQFFEEQKLMHLHPEKYRGLSFNHSVLDEKTGGARPGDLVAVGGAHKAGKSIVGLAWALGFSKQLFTKEENEIVLIVSLEMQHHKLAARAVANMGGIDSNKFRDIKLEEEDWDIFREVIEDLKQLPILWNVNCSTIAGIKAEIKKAEDQGYIVRVIVIDYFQLMDADGDKEWEQLAKISKACKQIAMKKSATVFLITQQTTETLNNIKKAKQRGSVAGGRSLERDLDLFMVILPFYEDGEEVPHLREVYVSLARDAEMGFGVPCFFSGKYARFGELYPEDIPAVEINEEQEVLWANW